MLPTSIFFTTVQETTNWKHPFLFGIFSTTWQSYIDMLEKKERAILNVGLHKAGQIHLKNEK